jgi:hypothetical protein
LDYSPDWHYNTDNTGRTDPLDCPSGLPGRLRSVNPAAVRAFQTIRFLWSVGILMFKGFDESFFVAKNIP